VQIASVINLQFVFRQLLRQQVCCPIISPRARLPACFVTPAVTDARAICAFRSAVAGNSLSLGSFLAPQVAERLLLQWQLHL